MSRTRGWAFQAGLAAFLLTSFVCGPSGCSGLASPAGPPPDASGFREIAGVTLQIDTRDPDLARAAAAITAALAEGERVAKLILAEIDTSEIDILNRVPSHVFIDVSPETSRALARTLEIAEESGGAFDPTIGPLLDLWSVYGNTAAVPRNFEINIALRNVDYLDIELGEDGHSVRRLSRRTVVDMGPVARGSVVDAALESLRIAQVPAARVSLGSITAVFGGTAAAPWTCPIHHPGENVAEELSMTSGSVASAAPTRVRSADDGQVVHELIDGRTGRPAVAARWAAATANDAASAAGYATAVFILGDEAREMIEANDQLEAKVDLVGSGTWASAGFGRAQ